MILDFYPCNTKLCIVKVVPMKFSREALKGNLTTLLLSAVEGQPRHAYEIIAWLRDESLQLLEMAEGTVYPSLHRLEREGLLSSETEERSGRRPVRRYSLTARGRRELERGQKEWRFFRRAVDMILNHTESPTPPDTTQTSGAREDRQDTSIPIDIEAPDSE